MITESPRRRLSGLKSRTTSIAMSHSNTSPGSGRWQLAMRPSPNRGRSGSANWSSSGTLPLSRDLQETSLGMRRPTIQSHRQTIDAQRSGRASARREREDRQPTERQRMPQPWKNPRHNAPNNGMARHPRLHPSTPEMPTRKRPIVADNEVERGEEATNGQCNHMDQSVHVQREQTIGGLKTLQWYSTRFVFG